MFVGREHELELLREPNWRDQAQLIVVYGRRRVGKTALVEEAYRDDTLWKFDGLEGVTRPRQLRHFANQLGGYEPSVHAGPVPRSWAEALDLLVKSLRTRKNQQTVLFFDEFQWMASMRAPLVSLFKSCWDNHLSKQPGLRVVLCGSVSSFMVKKVIRSRALYGRVSTELDLQPMSLDDARLFFGKDRTEQEIMEVAMCLGTIPQYLKELNPQLSLMQNLHEYAFRPGGFFFGEFQRIFISHFGRNRTYERILDLLSVRARSTQELAKACRTSTGGTFTGLLSDLEMAGFIEKVVPWTGVRAAATSGTASWTTTSTSTSGSSGTANRKSSPGGWTPPGSCPPASTHNGGGTPLNVSVDVTPTASPTRFGFPGSSTGRAPSSSRGDAAPPAIRSTSSSTGQTEC